MSLFHFLPGVLKELVKHVPSLAFEITDWSSVKRDLPLISTRLFTGAGVRELKAVQGKAFPELVSFTGRTGSPQGSSQAPSELKQKGDALLRYYFAQLTLSEGLFLDLRDTHFQWVEGRLDFQPNGFWFQFSEKFRLGILELYEGFYLSHEVKFENGLIQTGLMDRAWSGEEQAEIKNLFRSHFGVSLEHPMDFKLSQFQETFLKVFQFLLRKKVKLSSEFMVFGIYLITLYLSLESYGTQHEVKSLYLEGIQGRSKTMNSASMNP